MKGVLNSKKYNCRGQRIEKYRINKDTLLNNLPEKIGNEFLYLLGTDDQFCSLTLNMIKSDYLIIECWEDMIMKRVIPINQ